LQSILEQPVRANGIGFLGASGNRSEKLSIANGADGGFIEQTPAEADARAHCVFRTVIYLSEKFRQNHVTETSSVANAFSPIESNISKVVGTRQLFPAGPTHKLAFTVWANVVHCLGARRAISALVTANISYPAVCKRRPAFFTFAFQFHCHERKLTRNDR